MNIIKNITCFAFILFALTGCDLADPIESEITEYADFNMEGESFIYHQVGTAFTDPGVTAMEGEDELEVQITGTVDPNVTGVYYITYSAVNSDGFAASADRIVAVGDKEVAFNRDLSGVYAVGTSSNTVTITEPGIYQNSDVLPPNSISVWMVDLGNGDLVIPPQPSRFGSVSADPSVSPGSYGRLDSETSFTLSLKIGGNPLFLRTFTKQ